jgi:PAS domain S-box-containing protein/putative nucleotidyltransferase with HDIG domain
MTESHASRQQLLAEIAALRAQLDDAEETLRAIQGGEADALVLSGPAGEHIHTLEGALEPYRVMVEAMGEGPVTLSPDGTLLYCNGHFAEWVKLPREQIVGMSLQGMIAKQDRQRFDVMLPRGAQEVVRETLMLQAADGTQTPALFSLSPLPQSEGKVISVVIADLSEVAAAAAARSRVDAALKNSEQAYRTLAHNLPGMVYRVFLREAGRMEFSNAMPAQMTGYAADELIAGEICSIEPLILDEDRSGVEAEVIRAIAEKRAFAVEYQLRHRDGSIRWMTEHGMPVYGTDDAPLYIDGVIFDITEQKQAEEDLKLFRTIIDNSSDAIEVFDPVTMRFLDVNETECLELGYSREEMLSMSNTDIDPVFNADLTKEINEQIRQTGEVRFESVHRRKDGSTFPVEISAKLIEIDKPYLLGIVRDITERKEAEEALCRTNRALQTLSAGNLALVRAENENELLRSITEVIAQQGGYLLAWVGFAEHDENKTVRPVARSGHETSYLDDVNITWADTERGRGPTGTAIRTARTVVNHDIHTNPAMAPWHETAIKRGYQSSIALPLISEGQAFGSLNIYSVEPDFFTAEEATLLEELANDLAYGIITLRTREAHEQQATILRQNLEQSIQTIAATVEARDPYTAGHQKRVAELATAIAQEMGLPEEQINGIHLAATIHDLGKIRVPAEILSKPGKLNAVEFQLIQMHPQEGYDILKEVKFPWPIANIILQHHEKLDGSGYPQGLRGDAILLEAKILTVADVVEAMSSHRPYRVGLGIDTALAEIEAQRGIQFDPVVVDACLKLFRESGYTIPD